LSGGQRGELVGGRIGAQKKADQDVSCRSKRPRVEALIVAIRERKGQKRTKVNVKNRREPEDGRWLNLGPAPWHDGEGTGKEAQRKSGRTRQPPGAETEGVVIETSQAGQKKRKLRRACGPHPKGLALGVSPRPNWRNCKKRGQTKEILGGHRP